MTSPRAVAFDLDGLMFNTEDVYWEVGSELMRRRGRKYDQALNDAIMGRPPRACFEMMIEWHSLDDTWEGLQNESEEIFVSLLGDGVAPMAGLLELLDALEAADIPKAICTSSSRDVLLAVLSSFQMEPRFQFTLSASEITHGKPDPEIYVKAAQRFAVEPPKMLVLEDSQMGCQSAAAAGAFTVAVPTGLSADQDFSAASLVIDNLADRRLYEVLGLGARGEGLGARD